MYFSLIEGLLIFTTAQLWTFSSLHHRTLYAYFSVIQWNMFLSVLKDIIKEQTTLTLFDSHHLSHEGSASPFCISCIIASARQFLKVGSSSIIDNRWLNILIMYFYTEHCRFVPFRYYSTWLGKWWRTPRYMIEFKCRPLLLDQCQGWSLLNWQKSAYCLSLIFHKFELQSFWTLVWAKKKKVFESLPRLHPSANGVVITPQLSGPVCSVTVGQTLQSILHCPLHSLQTSPWFDLSLRLLSLNRGHWRISKIVQYVWTFHFLCNFFFFVSVTAGIVHVG